MSLAEWVKKNIDIGEEISTPLNLVSSNQQTNQNDPALLIEPILDFLKKTKKLFEETQIKTYPHPHSMSDEIVVHSQEKTPKNVLYYEFLDPSSNEAEDVISVVSKSEKIDGFKVEIDGEKSEVELQNKNSIILKSAELVVWFRRYGFFGDAMKAQGNLKLDTIEVANEQGNNSQLVPTAIIIHQGSAINSGHYFTYLLMKKLITLKAGFVLMMIKFQRF